MVKARGISARSKPAALARVGVSWIALLAAGAGGPAWAAAQDQSAAQGQTQNPAAAPSSSSPAGSIVVTGRRRAIQAATDRKKNSEAIIDSVVADDAGKLPDNSITEVLQRVAGVSIVRFAALNDPDHFSVEGSGIQVRGLSGVASRLNGREIFSANAGRALLWGDVTPELMSAVDVYKTGTADLIEGGTGGQVDLRTKLPFDFKSGWHMAASGEISKGDFAKKTDPSISALISNRWSTPIGQIGVLVDLAYSKLSTNSQFFRMEPYLRTKIGSQDYFIPGGYDYGEDDYQRKRTGIYGALQWAPSDSLRFTGIFFQSRYKSQTIGHGAFVTSQTLGVDPAESVFDDAGGLISSPNVFQRDTGTFLPSNGPISSGGNSAVVRSNEMTRDYSLAFQFTPASSPFSLSGSIQRVNSTAVNHGMNIFRDVSFPTSFGLDLSGNLPKITIPESGQAAFDDPANYFWSASMPHDADNKGRLDSAQLDAEYKFDNSFFRSVKIGGRLSKRTERDLDNGYNWSALGRGWNGDPQMTFANAAPGDVSPWTFGNFFHGNLPVPANLLFPSIDLTGRSIGEGRIQLHSPPPAGFCAANIWNCSYAGPAPETGYGGPGYRTPGFVLPDDQRDFSTKNSAVYALVRFGESSGLGFSGNVGARLVHLTNHSHGYFLQGQLTFIDQNGNTTILPATKTEQDGGASFTRLLPAVNLTYSPTNAIKVRAAYTRTMDLPTFTALSAAGSLGVATTPNPVPNQPGIFANFTTTQGNPELEPTMSDNLDASFEWYPHQGTTVHLALFHKYITNLPIYRITQLPVTVVFSDGSILDTFASATNVVNADKPATVNGFEIGAQTFFDFLPGWLKGFGVEGNYTYIDSKNPGDRYLDIFGVASSKLPVQGLSKHNFNATLMYEKDPFSIRIAYSWRSKYLQTTTGNGTTPTYQYYPAPGVPLDIDGDGNPDRTQISLPVYGDTYGQLDAGVRFKVNQHISLSIQGTNLLNATQRTLMGGYPKNKLYVRSWFQSDRRASVGVNVAF